MRQRTSLGCLLALSLLATAGADDEVFSGPQPGEKTPGFKVIGVFGGQAGKEFDPIKEAKGKPTVLIFCHQLTRPSAAVMRAAGGYAATLREKGVQVQVIRLHADRTEAKAELERSRAGFPEKVPAVISADGAEGPGAYGLNRKVALTILVAKDNKVTANFALVQPSVTDAGKIGEAVAEAAGVKAPTQKEMEAFAFPGRKETPKAGERDPQLVELLRAVIQKDASPEDVKKAAAAVEKHVGTDKRLHKQLGEIAATVVRLKYGTAEAQKQMKAWAEKYRPADKR